MRQWVPLGSHGTAVVIIGFSRFPLSGKTGLRSHPISHILPVYYRLWELAAAPHLHGGGDPYGVVPPTLVAEVQAERIGKRKTIENHNVGQRHERAHRHAKPLQRMRSVHERRGAQALRLADHMDRNQGPQNSQINVESHALMRKLQSPGKSETNHPGQNNHTQDWCQGGQAQGQGQGGALRLTSGCRLLGQGGVASRFRRLGRVPDHPGLSAGLSVALGGW